MLLIIALRKLKSADAERYFHRCPNYIAAGHIPVCELPCRICCGSRRFIDLLKFYAKRDRADRPERKLWFIFMAILFLNAKFVLAFTKTLQELILSYVRSLKIEIGLLLHEPLFPVLEYVYSDLIRCGTRDHLLGKSFGISEEMSSFSSQLMYHLGKI